MPRKGNNPAVVPFDPEDQDSIFHMVPASMQASMQMINPVWLTWKETTQIKNFEIDARDMRIRLKFWDEYFAARDQGRKMSMRQVWNGTCSHRYWTDGILKSPKKLSFILNMPADYEASMKALHYMAIARLEEIVKWPLKSGGKPNLGVADRVIKVFELIDNRVKGVAVQRMQVEQKNLNMNYNKEVTSLPTDLKEIEREIAELEAREKKTLPASESQPIQEVLEVTTSPVSVEES